MDFLENVVTRLSKIIDNVKGDYTIQAFPSQAVVMDNLTAKSVEGYQVVIYCQKKQVVQRFRKWYIPDCHMNKYRVFSVPSETAPVELKEACELDVCIDQLFPNTPNDFVQKEVVIGAYLERLLNSLRKEPMAA